jgi:hypothetical protein
MNAQNGFTVDVRERGQNILSSVLLIAKHYGRSLNPPAMVTEILLHTNLSYCLSWLV